MNKNIKIAFLSAFLISNPLLAIADNHKENFNKNYNTVSAKTDKTKNNIFSDTWIEAKLFTTIALNSELSIFDIEGDVENGVATLKGEVDSDIRKDLASEIAKSIDGIKTVKNDIKVVKVYNKKDEKLNDKSTESVRSFGQTIDDLTINASVKSKLIANSNTNGLSIDVDTYNGKVTLKGNVESSTEKELVEQIAVNTSGVNEVENNLEISDSTKS